MDNNLYNFLAELERRDIHFDLTYHRDGYVMVIVSVPGERWEIEYSKSGEVEVEIFRSDGEILGKDALEDLFSRFSD